MFIAAQDSTDPTEVASTPREPSLLPILIPVVTTIVCTISIIIVLIIYLRCCHRPGGDKVTDGKELLIDVHM